MDDEIKCPHCGAEEECEHYLAGIDLTFGEIFGGYAYGKLGKYDAELASAFAKLFDAGKRNELDWGYEDPEAALANAWEDYLAERSSGDEAFPSTFSVEIALLSDYASMDVEVLETESDGAPGMSARMIYVFAEKPEDVLESAISCVPDLLEEKLTGFLG